jgi:hypothetical protein
LLATRFFDFYENRLTRRAKQGHDGIMASSASHPLLGEDGRFEFIDSMNRDTTPASAASAWS